MSDGLQVALAVAAIVLAALLVGALLPVLFEARATLRRARRMLDDAAPRLVVTLDQASALMGRVEQIAADLEPRAKALAASLDEAQKVMKIAVALGAAVGPAVAAAVRGYQAARQDDGGSDGDEEPGGLQVHPGASTEG